ncbi:MAG: hypothetical protein ACI90V_008863, partial [Bacillariaceae sp.]
NKRRPSCLRHCLYYVSWLVSAGIVKFIRNAKVFVRLINDSNIIRARSDVFYYFILLRSFVEIPQPSTLFCRFNFKKKSPLSHFVSGCFISQNQIESRGNKEMNLGMSPNFLDFFLTPEQVP